MSATTEVQPASKIPLSEPVVAEPTASAPASDPVSAPAPVPEVEVARDISNVPVVPAVAAEPISVPEAVAAPVDAVQSLLETNSPTESQIEVKNETQEQPLQNGHLEPAVELKELIISPESLPSESQTINESQMITESENISVQEQSQSFTPQNEQHVLSETIVEEKRQEIVRFENNDAKFKSTFDFWWNFY